MHLPRARGVVFGGVFVKVASSPKLCLKPMRLLLSRPTYVLSVLWLLCLAVCAATAWLALQQPWLGVQLAGASGKVRAATDVMQQIPPGAEVRRIVSATGVAVDLHPEDIGDNTEFPASYAAVDQAYKKQDALDAALHAGNVRLVWAAADGKEQTAIIQPRSRPLASLPAMFWFTLFVASMGFMISCWVLLVCPQDWGARLFALTGAGLFVSGMGAAYLSTIELAMSSERLHISLAINYFGTFMFGCALIALFLSYPRQLVKPRRLLWLLALYIPWYLAEQLELLPGPGMGVFVAIPSFLLLSVAAAVMQWRLTRNHPLERAALRWFLLSIFVGCSLFTLTNVVPLLFGVPALIPVGYAFGFFLIMYVGIALGLRRYRLFDIDEWAYRVFLWVAGATAVIALDALLIFTGVTQSASLGISLLLCGGLYFPFRQWLWQRIVSRQAPNFESLLPEISAIAFTASSGEQQARWEGMLQRIFDPLEIKPDIGEGSGIREEGLSMLVLGCVNLPAFALRYAGRGSRLFSTRDAVFAAALSQLLEQIMSGRTSYEQGVAQERLRIGRDLHDNIGARLLKLIHHLRGTPNAEVARDAMKDLRTAIASMDAQPVPLPNALADWRAEAGSRCEAAGCRLHWQQNETLPDLDLAPRVKATLESVMRELITNALKHATPNYIRVEVDCGTGYLRMSVANDGAIADPLMWKDGYGLRNMRGRLEELGGSLSIAAGENEVRLMIEASLR